ncbi:MAG: DUF2029 domain-containing protein [Lachnospiraceae bacterium]|nr:DUF2029 domain-containing protein [Lachnospiraceae bacterium]
MSETSRWKKILPELLAVILCLGVLCVGVSLKEGYHMDELLSFELADARYNPWIVPTQPEGRLAKFVREEIQGDSLGETLMNLKSTVTDVLKNRGSSKLLSYKADVYEEPAWITSGQFRDYVTVDGSDAFDYLSVYFNVKDDNHPPVHFMLLHTMSSLFPGTLSPWLGCTINLICVGITLWLLLRLGRKLSEILGMEEQGRLLGTLAVLLYGLSTGALASVLLIRMYCLLSCLCVALLSIHVEKWKEHGFDRSNKGLIAITVLGFLTQYFFLFYCILLAAVTAAGLLCSKRMRELWIYIRSMVVAAVIGLVLFPFAIADVFSSGRGVEALDNLTSGFAGYGARLLAFARILADRTVGDLLLGAGCATAVVLAVVLWYRRHRGQELSMSREVRGILCMLIIPVVGYYLLASRMSPYLVDRYVMPMFPMIALLFALLLCCLGKRLAKASGWKERLVGIGLMALIIVVQGLRLASYDGEYLYRGYGQQEQLAEEYASLPCICVYAGVGYYENLPEFMHYDRTLLVTAEELAERKDVDSLRMLDRVVVLIKPGVEEETVSSVLREKYGMEPEETLFSEGVHGDNIYLYVR